MKIALLADIQINCGSKTTDRATDARLVLSSTAKSIASNKPDYIVIAGDIFERHQTTDDERKLYTDFIHALLDSTTAKIVVIDGNHDIRHKGFDYYNGIDTSKHTNVLAAINDAIANDRYCYSQTATFWHFHDAAFACWSELAKFDSFYGYASPWKQCIDRHPADVPIFEVYHGTLSGCASYGHQLDADAQETEMIAHTKATLLGHIHQPQVFTNSLGNTCIYPSSLLVRSFDEGDRYCDAKCEYERMNLHGYMLMNVDTNEITFISIHQPTAYVTLQIDNNCSKEDVQAVLSKYANKQTKFKIVVDSAMPDVLSYCYNAIASQPNWKLDKTEATPKQANDAFTATDARPITMTTDAFVDIAKSILPALDDNVLAKTLELLRQECNFHLHADMPAIVRFDSIEISNFKTIDNAVIELGGANGLYALSGNNGNGKTTIIEAICFACTGQHNATFKHNAKNKQLLRLFNDKRPDIDTVALTMKFAVNSNAYTATTVLTKSMKPGWTMQNWKAFVATVTKSVRIADASDVEVYTDDAAVEFLHSIFGSYEDFAILHSINQATLDQLGNMDDDAVANYVLQRLGYSVLSKLQYFYNGCQQNALDAVQLTDQRTYMQLEAAKFDADKAIEDCNAEIANATVSLTNANNVLAELNAKLVDLQSKLVPIDNAKYATGLAYAKQYDAAYVAEQADNAAKQLANAIACNESQANASKELAELTNAIDKATNDYKTTLNSLFANEHDALQVKYEHAKESYNATNQDVCANQAKLQELKNVEQSANASINLLTMSIDNHKRTIERLLSDKADIDAMVCPACKQKLANNAELLLAKQHEIDSENAYMQEDTTKLADANALLASIAAQQTECTACLNEALTVNKHNADAVDNYAQQLANLKPEQFAEQVDRTELNVLLCRQARLTDSIKQLPVYNIAEYQHAVDAWKAIQEQLSYVDNCKATVAANELLQNAITSTQSEQVASNAAIIDLNATIARANERLKTEQANAAVLTTLMQQRANYDITKQALKQYKWLAYEGLPQYLYANAVSIINSFIDRLNLPSSICPRLSPTEYGMLVLVDRAHNGEQICRPIQAASGMELTIAALSLCLALHSAKLTVDFPLLMIDEVSGKLNTGTADDQTDYLTLFKHMLQASSDNLQMLIVDHRLERTDFTKCFDVIKDNAMNTTTVK